ncbi:hypothetical protein [Legionella sainthelensi]|uniref:hypothetical protein n=1 Tax=Legionella sainthelensi TaxID=28087 RepID=UPI000E20AAB3|nr:hypothetical protein [Legionella sainthelensi]
MKKITTLPGGPKELFKDEFLRQIEFGLNGLYRCMENLQQTITPNHSENKSFKHYLDKEKEKEKEKEKILKHCFENNIQKFEQLLEENITYEINSFKAGFIGGSSLHGYLGPHFYIVIKIEKSEFLIEFTQAPADTGEQPDQQELRTLKRRKIIEMLALHNKLQETMPCTVTVDLVLKSMKPGDNDCQTFINNVLVGQTNQPPL